MLQITHGISPTKPVGIIQKNKDWNTSTPSRLTSVMAPVGIIQKNKDWNPGQAMGGFLLCDKPVGIIQKNKDWNKSKAWSLQIKSVAGRHHPEEQGLKRREERVLNAPYQKPVGIIQKNKDWNRELAKEVGVHPQCR